MDLHHFILTVKHDKGVVNLHTSTYTAEAAKKIIMAAERCPERAIREVRCRDVDGYEMSPLDLAQRISMRPAATRRAKHIGGPAMPYKVQTVGERWRRVYRAKGGETYVLHAGLKVLVQLPPEDLG